MIKFNKTPTEQIPVEAGVINSFLEKSTDSNIDWNTVESFGEEWSKFDHFSKNEIDLLGSEYFDILPDTLVSKNTVALDVGCGTGRWTKYLSKKVGFIEAIDPSKAVFAAHKLLASQDNIRISLAEVSDLPFPDESFDLVFSLGVLHHIPDTAQGIIDCVKKVKKDGYFLVYLYYSLDNRGWFYKKLYQTSDLLRKMICRFSPTLKKISCDLIAYTVYYPLIFLGYLTKTLFGDIYHKLPLAYYVGKSLNVARNDALDRFGTPLEQRFSKVEIKAMMEAAGLTNIEFSNNYPFWHAIGQKTK